MQKMPHLETMVFSGSALLLFAASLTIPRLHFHPASTHAAYGFAHLSLALLASAIFCGAIAAAFAWLRQPARTPIHQRSSLFFLLLIAALFGVFWLPVFVSGGFVQDDWLQLLSASVRHIIPLHPSTSWWAVDSVDGNFRPLGTVLYFGYLFRSFGIAPHLFLFGNFILSLGTVVVAYLIVLELGYSRTTAALAGSLYLSRGLLYTQIAWVSAIGDCIVSLLTSLAVLLLLKATRRQGQSALALHLGAYALFAISTLGKQSAYTTPLIVVALLLLRPGVPSPLPWRRRIHLAALAAAVYGATVLMVFLHARSLIGNHSPYPIKLSLFGLLRTFAYIFWYFEALYAPSAELLAKTHSAGLIDLAGAILTIAVAVLLYRHPSLLGRSPRELLFLLLAGLSSVSLFVLLQGRNEAYYGAMLAFWFSLGLAIVLTNVRSPGFRRLAVFLASVLLAIGFLDVRLKQIGLVWTGGYFWGEADVHEEATQFAELRNIVAATPEAHTAVLIDPPMLPRFYTAMLFLADTRLNRVLVYDSHTSSYFANDRQGGRPLDGLPALRDVDAYRAQSPVASEAAAAWTGQSPSVWIRCDESHFAREATVPSHPKALNQPPRAR